MSYRLRTRLEMRPGSEIFTSPSEPLQRRYETARSCFVDDTSAEMVGERFGSSSATIHRLASELRGGGVSSSASSKPGPKGPASRRPCATSAEAPGRRAVGHRDRRRDQPAGDAGLAPD